MTRYTNLHALTKTSFPSVGNQFYTIMLHRPPLANQGPDFIPGTLPERFCFYVPTGTDHVVFRIDSIRDDKTWAGLSIIKGLTRLYPSPGQMTWLEGSEHWAKNGGGVVLKGSFSPKEPPYWCHGAFTYERGGDHKGPLMITITYQLGDGYKRPSGLPDTLTGPDIDLSYLGLGNLPSDLDPISEEPMPCNPFVQAFCAAKGMDCKDNGCVPKPTIPTEPVWDGPTFDVDQGVLTIPKLLMRGPAGQQFLHVKFRIITWEGADIHWKLEDYGE